MSTYLLGVAWGADRGGQVVGEGSRDHAARVRCPGAAGLHPGSPRPLPVAGNGSRRPLSHHLAAAIRALAGPQFVVMEVVVGQWGWA